METSFGAFEDRYYQYNEDNDGVTVESGWVYGAAILGAVAVKAGAEVISGIGVAAVPATQAIANVDTNKLNHIFNNAGHKLEPLVQSFSGDINSTYMAVQDAVQNVVDTQNLSGIFDSVVNPVIVDVNGYLVHVRGAVTDGVFRIGTFFIK